MAPTYSQMILALDDAAAYHGRTCPTMVKVSAALNDAPWCRTPDERTARACSAALVKYYGSGHSPRVDALVEILNSFSA